MAKQYEVNVRVGDALVTIPSAQVKGALERYDAQITRDNGLLKLACTRNGVLLPLTAPIKIDPKQANGFLSISITAAKGKGANGFREHNAFQEPTIGRLIVSGDVKVLDKP